MKIEVPYGKDKINVEVPDENFGEVIYPNYPNKVKLRDEFKILTKALEKPIDSKDLMNS
jgi:hypothetical protein